MNRKKQDQSTHFTRFMSNMTRVLSFLLSTPYLYIPKNMLVAKIWHNSAANCQMGIFHFMLMLGNSTQRDIGKIMSSWIINEANVYGVIGRVAHYLQRKCGKCVLTTFNGQISPPIWIITQFINEEYTQASINFVDMLDILSETRWDQSM